MQHLIQEASFFELNPMYGELPSYQEYGIGNNLTVHRSFDRFLGVI